MAAGKIALVVAMLICIFAWNYFVLNVTKTRAGAQTSEYRYHLIGMIPLMCVTGAMFVAWLKSLRTEQQKILFAVACLGINGDICRLLSRDTQYLCLQDDATVWGYDYYTWAQGGPIPGTNAVVAVRWDIADFGDSFELYGYKLVKFDELGNRKLYCFVE